MAVTVEDVAFYRIFNGLAETPLLDIAAHLSARAFARGAFVYRETEPCAGFFLLKQGRVKLSRMSSDGREQAISIVPPGDHFGFIAVFDEGPYAVSAQALDDVVVHFMSRTDLLDLTARHSQLASALLTTTFDYLHRLASLVEQLSSQSVTGRLAAYLLEQAPAGGPVRLGVSQSQLAALVGTRREVVSRALARLQKDGILHIRYPEIRILDLARLREML